MDQMARELADYLENRLQDSLRAVAYHTSDKFSMVYIRDDLVEKYPMDRVNQFLRASRNMHTDLQHLDNQLGTAEASLHVLEDGLIIQFHFSGDGVVLVAMEQEIGRNFIQFVNDCFEQMS